jgi:hypothetical protein
LDDVLLGSSQDEGEDDVAAVGMYSLHSVDPDLESNAVSNLEIIR